MIIINIRILGISHSRYNSLLKGFLDGNFACEFYTFIKPRLKSSFEKCNYRPSAEKNRKFSHFELPALPGGVIISQH
jgi:hypothetical protein